MKKKSILYIGNVIEFKFYKSEIARIIRKKNTAQAISFLELTESVPDIIFIDIENITNDECQFLRKLKKRQLIQLQV